MRGEFKWAKRKIPTPITSQWKYGYGVSGEKMKMKTRKDESAACFEPKVRLRIKATKN